jgi:hypothetical protein
MAPPSPCPVHRRRDAAGDLIGHSAHRIGRAFNIAPGHGESLVPEQVAHQPRPHRFTDTRIDLHHDLTILQFLMQSNITSLPNEQNKTFTSFMRRSLTAG